jgi:TPP-dependent pyruvate/acetoin dehydrogenase alpha subunit
MNDAELYRALYRIRRFEETVLENFSKGIFFGTTHTYLGQEANAVAILSQLQPTDIVFSNHRCHGHYLAFGGNMRALFAELMGKSTGVCGGRGGSQHLHWDNFYSNGIQGGIVPIATGMALAEKFKGTKAIVVAFLGDGTMGEGVIYEAFNMASLWGAPILYVIEDNRIAQTTPINMALAGEIRLRLEAFDIPVLELDTSDVLEILPTAEEALSHVRQHLRPMALVLHTFRFGPHSKGDDAREKSDLEKIRGERDPVTIQASRLGAATRQKIQDEVASEVLQAFQQALSDPMPDPSSITSSII